MLMIIVFHINHHAISTQLSDLSIVEKIGDGFFCKPVFYKRFLIPEFFSTLGITANYVFILISGYYSIGQSKSISQRIEKTLIKIISQMLFISVLLSIVSFLFYTLFRWNNSFYIEPFHVFRFNSEWWFVGWYLAIYSIGLVFLDRYKNRLAKSFLMAIVILLFGLSANSWSGEFLDSLGEGFRALVSGISIWLLGGYINKYGLFCKVKTYIFCFLLGIIYALELLSFYNITIRNIDRFTMSNDGQAFVQTITTPERYGTVYIVMSVLIFLIALRYDTIKSSRIINWIASGTFMIYLFHETPLIWNLYGKYNWVALLYKSPVKFLLQCIGVSIALFVMGIGIWSFYCCIKRVVKNRLLQN